MGDSLSLPSERGPIFGLSESLAEQEVFLAVTALSPAMAEEIGAPVAYHSSIIVNKTEYTFAHFGIVACEGCQSHAHMGGPGVVLPMGKSTCGGKAMQDAFANYFQPRSYDLLIKNCNHFSDCALFYMLGEHLPCKYMAAEQLAGLMPTTMIQLLIRMLGLGEYRQNPRAMGFDARFVQKFVGSSVAFTC